MTQINWADFGIEMSIESVQKQMGDHATDRKIVNDKAMIPTVVDVDKFIAEFGGATMLDFVNGTSLRVKAQAVARRLAGERDKGKIEQALLNMIRSVRNPNVRVQVIVHSLPNGMVYSGTDLIEYQQSYMAALVDAGVENATAGMIAKMQTL